MRFAFLSTEFPTTRAARGGLGTHLRRMSRLLVEAGHRTEIFVPVDGASETIMFEGALVHHLGPARGGWRRALRGALRVVGLREALQRRRFLDQSAHLAAAVARAEAARGPFDVVQSCAIRGLGLALPRRPGRLAVVRLSAARDLYKACDGLAGPAEEIKLALEEEETARADLAFAPSRFTAAHYARKLRRPVETIRPPVFIEAQPEGTPPEGLPPRYLFHFAGILMPRKGTDLVATAMRLALQETPDLAMVWAGRPDGFDPAAWARLLEGLEGQVTWLGPLEKPALYGVLRGAVAAVLPSRVDNLPNTVLESLNLGVPVIGTDRSSIEELVEPGRTGLVVPNGSAEALAEALVQAWRGGLCFAANPWADSPVARDYRPDVAIVQYLAQIEAAREGRTAAI